jgi:hypothetical protein
MTILDKVTTYLLPIAEYLSSVSPEVKAAWIGTLSTIALGSIAIWQIGRQAAYATKQTRHNEALKLKLQIYEKALDTLKCSTDAELNYSSFLSKLQMQLDHSRIYSHHGHPIKPPDARVKDLIQLQQTLTDRVVEAIRLIERWQIVDPRISVFQHALNAAQYDIQKAHGTLFEMALKSLPVETSGALSSGNILPWKLPEVTLEEEFRRRLRALDKAISILGTYIMDFQTELQNALLEELFKHKAPIRKPLDPALVTVTLDRHEELSRYFLCDTPWGKFSQRIHKETAASFSDQSE